MKRSVCALVMFISLFLQACANPQQTSPNTPLITSLENVMDTSGSFRSLNRQCQSGDFMACAQLGSKYLGKGQLVEGEANLQTACDKEVVAACQVLGKFLAGETYFHEAEELERVAPLFRKACDYGYAESCRDLGMIYRVVALRKPREERDAELKKSFELFHAGCDKLNYESCRMVAAVYYDGDGVERDRDLAIQFYDQSCAGGNAASCHFLGTAYSHGLHVEIDLVKGLALTLKGCELGERAACRSVHSHHLRECNAGHGGNCLTAAHMYEAGEGLAIDTFEWRRLEQASEYFGKACQLGVEQACN